MYQLKQKDIKPLRDKILKEQNNRCLICGKVPKVACLDHHHKKRINGTGQVRGVLCSSCNIFIAKSENNSIRYGISQEDLPQILRNIAKYLEKEQYPYIHPSEAPPPKKLKKSSYNKLKKVYTQRKAFPAYPRSGKLTKPLKRLYETYGIQPEYYKT
jgi:hypothetical protein